MSHYQRLFWKVAYVTSIFCFLASALPVDKEDKDNVHKRNRRAFNCYKGICKQPPAQDLVRLFEPTALELEHAALREESSQSHDTSSPNEFTSSENKHPSLNAVQKKAKHKKKIPSFSKPKPSSRNNSYEIPKSSESENRVQVETLEEESKDGKGENVPKSNEDSDTTVAPNENVEIENKTDENQVIEVVTTESPNMKDTDREEEEASVPESSPLEQEVEEPSEVADKLTQSSDNDAKSNARNNDKVYIDIGRQPSSSSEPHENENESLTEEGIVGINNENVDNNVQQANSDKSTVKDKESSDNDDDSNKSLPSSTNQPDLNNSNNGNEIKPESTRGEDSTSNVDVFLDLTTSL